jgi:hypothetical protein
VVRYTGAGVSNLILSPAISTVEPYTIFAVIKAINTTTALFTLSTGIGTPPFALLEYTDGGVYNYGRSTGESFAGTWANAWHVLSTLQPGGGTCSGYIDGVVGIGTPGAVGPYLFDFGKLGNGDGDIAEVIFYNVTLSGTNRANIEKYLGTKYAISVAGGSAVQPDTVTGLVAWWKADSLG